MIEERAAWMETLRWHRDVGVSEALVEVARNRYTEQEKAPPVLQTMQEALAPKLAPKPVSKPALVAEQEPDADSIAVADARSLAKTAMSLEGLRSALESFEGCALKHSARSLVFADGNPEARVMLIGEAPGAEEDRRGLPFVGRSGRLLDKMLAAIGLNRESAYITNILPWRPSGNRNPTSREVELLRPFIERHVELVQPELLMLVGGVSAKSLLHTTTGILKLRGSWTQCQIGTQSFPALPTFHPAYLLRRPGDKGLAWRDFLSLKQRLDAGTTKESP